MSVLEVVRPGAVALGVEDVELLEGLDQRIRVEQQLLELDVGWLHSEGLVLEHVPGEWDCDVIKR